MSPRELLRRSLISVPLGIATGLFVALFLWSLDVTIAAFRTYEWLLYLLPVGGAGSAWFYQRFGNEASRGNQLLIEQIKQPTEGVPFRMAPLVLLTTLVTHLCGGSAGREGTAVQMGGGVAGLIHRILRLKVDDWTWLLTAGIAAGFGAVFGTPMAGAIFAIEVPNRGQINRTLLLPAVAAGFVGDATVTFIGIKHTHYHLDIPYGFLERSIDVSEWGQVVVAAVLFGFAARLFVWLTHRVIQLGQRYSLNPIVRPVFGGIVILLISTIIGNRSFLGLGVTSDPNSITPVSIVDAFGTLEIPMYAWLLKTLLTSITVGSGFRGGEVTPLFFIGSTLGRSLSNFYGRADSLFVALGFVTVFAAASRTPLACTVMAFELFRPQLSNQAGTLALLIAQTAVACFIATSVSGNASIYATQQKVQ